MYFLSSFDCETKKSPVRSLDSSYSGQQLIKFKNSTKEKLFRYYPMQKLLQLFVGGTYLFLFALKLDRTVERRSPTFTIGPDFYLYKFIAFLV